MRWLLVVAALLAFPGCDDRPKKPCRNVYHNRNGVPGGNRPTPRGDTSRRRQPVEGSTCEGPECAIPVPEGK
jgi:hypothetical protein